MKGKGMESVWTWTTIDADSKLIISYAIGDRDSNMDIHFMKDVDSPLSN